MISHHRWPEYSPKELACVLVGASIARPPPTDRYQTHKGFDFRRLRERLSGEFKIEKVVLSPFPALSWILNSQIFFLGSPRGLG